MFGEKKLQNENNPVIKAGKVETTCLLDIAGKCSDKTFVHVPVQGMVREINSGYWIDTKKIVHAKASGDSSGMEKSKGSQHHPI